MTLAGLALQSDAPAAQSDAFRRAMRQLAGAVSVVAVGEGEERTGFTATSVSSLSVDPPTLLVSVNRASSSWPVLLRRRSFSVNILAEDQAAVADRFAGRGDVKGVARYEGAQWRVLATGTPVLQGALAVADCVLEEAIERHSHAILIGRVVAVEAPAVGAPLLYWNGGYRQIG